MLRYKIGQTPISNQRIHLRTGHDPIANTAQRCYKFNVAQSKNHLRGVGGLTGELCAKQVAPSMAYTPPGSTTIHFDFTQVLITLDFNFISTGYTPPSSTALHFDFTIVLFPIDFEFAPEIPVPISKAMLLSLGIRFSGQVYKYWRCYVLNGKQVVVRYVVPNDPKSIAQVALRSKWAAGVQAWHNLSQSDKLHWRRVGVRKKYPITSLNAWMSAWMKDKI